MTELDVLELPAELKHALEAGGVRSVEELCAKTSIEVGSIVGTPRIERTKQVRIALHTLRLDVRQFHEDPVGWPNFPSRKAIRRLFDLLDLLPESRKALMIFLLQATTAGECLARTAPEDREKLLRLFALIEDDQQ